MIIDSQTLFSSTQNAYGAAGDVVSTNYYDLAPHLAQDVFYAADEGPGEGCTVVVTLNAAVGTTTTGTFQALLQANTGHTFDTLELSQEFPISPVLAQSVIVGSIAVTTGVLTVGTLTSGTVQVGAQVTGGTTPAGTLITSQLTGTPGGVGTYQTNCFIAVAAPTGTKSGYAGRSFSFRLAAPGLKRYLRICYRTAGQTTTGVTATAYIVKDTQTNQVAQSPAGFTVG